MVRHSYLYNSSPTNLFKDVKLLYQGLVTELRKQSETLLFTSTHLLFLSFSFVLFLFF